jgi:hypothetical protein
VHERSLRLGGVSQTTNKQATTGTRYIAGNGNIRTEPWSMGGRSMQEQVCNMKWYCAMPILIYAMMWGAIFGMLSQPEELEG